MRTLAAALLVGTFSSFAFAGATEFVPLQQRAQGESLIGASLLNDSVFANPAASAFTNVYAVDATFLNPKTFALSILDTKTSGMGGGVGYYRLPQIGSDQVLQGARLSLFGRASEHFGLGLTGKVVWGNLSSVDTRFMDIDAGFHAQFERLHFGASLENIFGGNTSISERREYALGVRANWEQIVFVSVSMTGETDNFRPQQFGFGAEYVSPYYFSLKGGYRIRPSEGQSYWSAGFSVLSPKVSLHYALEMPNQPAATPGHSFGTTFLF